MSYPVEIKANVESASIAEAMALLDLKAPAAEPRSIHFLDMASEHEPLALYAQHVILRLRTGADGADFTLKLRPCDTSRLPSAWAAADEGEGWQYRIEEDWTGEHHALSASLVVDLDSDVSERVIQGGDVALLVSDTQHDLFRGYTSHSLETDRLRLLGPIASRKWKARVRDRKINCEEWILDDTLRFLELSDREDDSTAAPTTQQALLEAYAALGIRLSTSDELKTKVALEYFSVRATP